MFILVKQGAKTIALNLSICDWFSFQNDEEIAVKFSDIDFEITYEIVDRLDTKGKFPYSFTYPVTHKVCYDDAEVSN